MGNAYYEAPHGVTDNAKLASLIESFRRGCPVPPVACQGYTGLTGSHRIAAYNAASKLYGEQAPGWEESPEPELETVQVSDEDYLAACRLLDVDRHGRDCNLFAAALYSVTDDPALRAALADQMGEYEGETIDTLARYA